MSVDLLVRAGRAAVEGAERPAVVAVRDGRVEALLSPDGPLPEATDEVTLADDEVLLPGLVDTHVHVNEPGRTEWEGFATATAAAAAGGVTTFADMPLNSLPPTVDVPALATKRAAAEGQCRVDVAFWGGAVPGNVTALRPLHEAGVVGFKCFTLDSGVPEFPPLDEAGLRAALREIATFDGLLAVHAEDAGTIEAAPDCSGRAYESFLASRPAEAECAAIRTVLRLAGEAGARVHVVHLSAADAVPVLAAAQAAGVRVSAETCPHYLTLAAADIPEGRTEFKCCPPIRDGGNREALWQALADGVVSMVVSDHSPCTPELKRQGDGDFGAAWGGIASLQLGLPLVWTEARRRGHSLADVVRWMATAPADLVGLSRKGRIAPGCDADLVAFAPDERRVVDPAVLAHRHPLTPYAGRVMTGAVRATWLRGRLVEGDPRGRLLD